MVTYYLNGVYFCECLEGSMMDLSIQAAQAAEAAKQEKYWQSVWKDIQKQKPIQYPVESKDVLLHLVQA